MQQLQQLWSAIQKPETVPDPSRLFVDVYREYIDKYLKENQLADGTANRYESYWRNFTMFMSIHHMYHVPLSEIRIKHAEQFRGWLRSHLKTCTIRHASRQVEVWKAVTRYAVAMEYANYDHLSPIKSQRDKPKKIISLEMNEVKRLMAYQFNSDIMRVVADLFLFQCFTGLSYSDIYKYNIVEKGGRLWIEGDRQKTEEGYIVYFFDEARTIFLKYQGHLPRLSNQKYNEWLKEVAAIVRIPKKLTTHVGRKTHATLLAERGAATKPISLVLGNTEKVCNDTYINDSYLIVLNDFERVGLKDKLLY